MLAQLGIPVGIAAVLLCAAKPKSGMHQPQARRDQFGWSNRSSIWLSAAVAASAARAAAPLVATDASELTPRLPMLPAMAASNSRSLIGLAKDAFLPAARDSSRAPALA